MFNPIKPAGNRHAGLPMAVMASMLILAGCSSNEDGPSSSAVAASASGASATLSPLTEQDITGNPLKGELVCAFSVGRSTLLYAAGNVATLDDAQGIVKFGDEVVTVRAPGGFDAMLRGNTFKGERVVAEVKLAEGVTQPEKAGSDGAGSYPPSTLTYLRNESAMRSVEGRWECGP